MSSNTTCVLFTADEEVREEVREEVKEEVKEEVGEEVKEEVGEEVKEEVDEEMKEEVDDINKPISLASLKDSKLSLSHLTL